MSYRYFHWNIATSSVRQTMWRIATMVVDLLSNEERGTHVSESVDPQTGTPKGSPWTIKNLTNPYDLSPVDIDELLRLFEALKLKKNMSIIVAAAMRNSDLRRQLDDYPFLDSDREPCQRPVPAQMTLKQRAMIATARKAENAAGYIVAFIVSVGIIYELLGEPLGKYHIFLAQRFVESGGELYLIDQIIRASGNNKLIAVLPAPELISNLKTNWEERWLSRDISWTDRPSHLPPFGTGRTYDTPRDTGQHSAI